MSKPEESEPLKQRAEPFSLDAYCREELDRFDEEAQALAQRSHPDGTPGATRAAAHVLMALNACLRPLTRWLRRTK